MVYKPTYNWGAPSCIKLVTYPCLSVQFSPRISNEPVKNGHQVSKGPHKIVICNKMAIEILELRSHIFLHRIWRFPEIPFFVGIFREIYKHPFTSVLYIYIT